LKRFSIKGFGNAESFEEDVGNSDQFNGDPQVSSVSNAYIINEKTVNFLPQWIIDFTNGNADKCAWEF